MRKVTLLALLLGVLLVAAPIGRVLCEDAADEDTGAEEEDHMPEEDEEPVDETYVVDLTSANWDEKIGKSKLALVEFYAPWCGHCQQLKPHYAEAAARMHEIDPSVVVAKLDATKESELAQKHGVDGYPTLKWFVDGEFAIDYNGERDTEGIIKWIKRRSGPAAVTVSSKDDLTKLENADEVVVFGYFKAFEGADYDAFIKAAGSEDEVVFAQTTTAAVAKAADQTKFGVTIITNFKGEPRAIVPVSSEDLKETIKANKLPPAVEFNEANSNKIFNSGIGKQIILLANASDLTADAAVLSAFKDVSKALRGKLVFVTVDLDGESKEPVINYFNVDESKAPVVVGFEMEKNRKFAFKGASVTKDSLLEFATSLADGTATPEYKSEEVPEVDEDAGLKTVVGKSFTDIVMDPKKDVLLEVYAPWCGHCRSVAPIYRQLAARFKDVESVVIAKMDGTENEHPDINVEGYPTFLFYPAGADKTAIPLEFQERELDDFIKFVKEHAKTSFTLPTLTEEELAAEKEAASKAADAEFGAEEYEGGEGGEGDFEGGGAGRGA